MDAFCTESYSEETAITLLTLEDQATHFCLGCWSTRPVES